MIDLRKGSKVVPIDPISFNDFYPRLKSITKALPPFVDEIEYSCDFPLPEYFVIDRLTEKPEPGDSIRLRDPRFKQYLIFHWVHRSLVKPYGGVAELADAPDSKSGQRRPRLCRFRWKR